MVYELFVGWLSFCFLFVAVFFLGGGDGVVGWWLFAIDESCRFFCWRCVGGVRIVGVAIPADSLRGIGTLNCDNWRRGILSRHRSFSSALAWRYRTTARASGYVKANAELGNAESLLKVANTGLYCDMSDDDFCNYAEVISKRLEHDFLDFGRRLGVACAVDYLLGEFEKLGVEFPIDLERGALAEMKKVLPVDDWENTKAQVLAACARAFCVRWWRRRLRKLAARGCEQVARSLGLVSKKKGLYCSDFRMSRRQGQQKRNRNLLERMQAENADGYKATLAELSDKGVSNPVNRHGELMTRIRGFEEIATELGFIGLFFTLTCPSKYHAVLSSGRRNSKYEGATPAEAQKYLCDQWAKIRAKWQREDIRCFGFRVAEPHHDGTPHWHLMLFVLPDRKAAARHWFMKYALQVDGGERGAIDNRADCVEIDPAKGSAAGYIAKYISKNIAGAGVHGIDYESGSGELWADTAARVDAWASCWGIRQFQQIGSVSVTVWRELRRIRNPELFDPAELQLIMAACTAGDWCEFVRLMGGPLVRRDDQPIRAWAELSDEVNQYGEIAERLRGVILRGVYRAVSKLHEWKITLVDMPVKKKAAGGSEQAASVADFTAARR